MKPRHDNPKRIDLYLIHHDHIDAIKQDYFGCVAGPSVERVYNDLGETYFSIIHHNLERDALENTDLVFGQHSRCLYCTVLKIPTITYAT